jgi:hypothetical protein
VRQWAALASTLRPRSPETVRETTAIGGMEIRAVRARMQRRVPEFQETAATKFSRAARDLIRVFCSLRERRRIRKLHLHGGNGRHRDVAAIEGSGNQRHSREFRCDIDREAIQCRELNIDLGGGSKAPGGLAVRV